MRLGSRIGIVALLAAFLLAAPANAYSPKHPKVQAVVDKAVKFLESGAKKGDMRHVNTLGGKTIIAYAVYKHRKNRNHPLVQEVLKMAEEMKDKDLGQKEVYILGVVLSFLTEFEDPALNPLIITLYQRLLDTQRQDGSWSYQARGDTSVIQYALLGLWAVKEAKIPGVDFYDAPVERGCNWLMRTQDPSGGWAYFGRDPGNFSRIKQDKVELSIFAAGASSMYIAADLLNFRKQATVRDDSPFVSLRKQVDRGKGAPTTTAVDHSRMWETLDLADRFWSNRGRIESGNHWQYYYMYSQERYLSFFSEVRGIPEPKNGPGWYNAGVDYLAKNQLPDGGWDNKSHSGINIDTAFAVLFLLRSTQTKIHPPTSGILLGGQGIPDNFEIAMQTKDGKVVAPKKKDQVEDLAALIRAIESQEIDINEVDMRKFVIEKKVEKSQLDKLKEDVANEPDYRRRLLSVNGLALGGLDNAPILIFALSDPDFRVVQAARDALRKISRRIGGFGLADNANEGQKAVAQRQWREWLESIRPDLEF